jgi:hypothetical protein
MTRRLLFVMVNAWAHGRDHPRLRYRRGPNDGQFGGAERGSEMFQL